MDAVSALIPPGKLNAVRNDPRVKAVGQDRTVHAVAQTLPTGIDRVEGEPGVPANTGVGVNVAGTIASVNNTINAVGVAPPWPFHGDPNNSRLALAGGNPGLILRLFLTCRIAFSFSPVE